MIMLFVYHIYLTLTILIYISNFATGVLVDPENMTQQGYVRYKNDWFDRRDGNTLFDIKSFNFATGDSVDPENMTKQGYVR